MSLELTKLEIEWIIEIVGREVSKMGQRDIEIFETMFDKLYAELKLKGEY